MPGAFGRHRVLHQIGTGALGPLFRAYDSSTDRVVAVKAFKPSSTPGEIVRVADALRGLVARPSCHPAAVALIEAGIEGTTPFLVMEWQMGEALDALRRRLAPIDLERAIAILAPLAAVIDAADEAGVGHGALHPRDVFVQHIAGAAGAAETVAVKVGGVGIASALADAGIAVPVRQPYVPAPGAASTPTAKDLYAFGVIAHELLTGRRPLGSGDQDGAFAPCLSPQVRVQVRRILSKMLGPETDSRFASAGAFVGELAAIAGAAGVGPAADVAVAEAAGELPPAGEVNGSPRKSARTDTRTREAHGPSSRANVRPARSRDWNDKFHSVPTPPPDPPSGHGPFLVGAVVVLLSVAIGSAVSYEFLRARRSAPAPAAASRVDASASSDTDVSVPSAAAQPQASGRATPSPGSADSAVQAPSREVAPAASEAAPAAPVSKAPAPSPSAAMPARPSSPAARAAATRGGALVVTSDPPGAMVTIDGRLSGETPVTARNLDPGPHAVLIARPGHVPYRRSVTIAEAAPAQRLHVVLEPGVVVDARATAPASASGVGMIDVDSRPRGADVRVDGAPAGPSPLRLPEMAPGAHTITLELGGYKIASRRVSVNSGKVSTLSVTLESLVR